MLLGWPQRCCLISKHFEQVPHLSPCAVEWQCQPRTHTRKQGQGAVTDKPVQAILRVSCSPYHAHRLLSGGAGALARPSPSPQAGSTSSSRCAEC